MSIPGQRTSYLQINGVSWGRLPGKACVSTSESEKEQPDPESPQGWADGHAHTSVNTSRDGDGSELALSSAPPSHSTSGLANRRELWLLLQTLLPSSHPASKELVPTTCSGNS